ncbi:DUF2281 domain-containing protein [Nostoc sphaeroides CHAB 2801]|uniref:DUF2281 domain-containing protein n=1 Tax=Nostoc sphaeroides TaxID=446679 RepID=UPI000E4F11C8|nr:DUF2281 domain-containing protein [Nostoc sphaeroides]MCC5628673.1 DUF2281 domain-containing protein [Nostoc sphaeroides CHAB 2801]
MTIKEKLIEEIESAPDALLTETLNFLRFFKTKQTQVQPTQHQVEFASHSTVDSTGNSLLEHLKTIDTWESDDLEECLNLVISSRGQAEFNEDNPFE